MVVILIHCFCYRFAGYCSPILFKNISDADIDCLQRFVRIKLTNIIKDKNVLVQLFGYVSAEDLSSFEFSRGERQLIKTLSSYVKKKIDEGGENQNINYYRMENVDAGNNLSENRENSTKTSGVSKSNHFFLEISFDCQKKRK